MELTKRYKAQQIESDLMNRWESRGVYRFSPNESQPVYSIDTPPATVSGKLHMGHIYSYTHTDLMARFWRMRGFNVFYPMGFDDNGLPTERLVEKMLGVTAQQIGRQAFIEKCLEFSEETEQKYRDLWRRLGLSIDWRYSYRTIDADSIKTAQLSFLDLHARGLVYRRDAPTLWCPECHTAIAQADVDDIERESEFLTLAFKLENGETLPIATTRPELLPACVAIFVHPQDKRYTSLVGQEAEVPLFGQKVPILEDRQADPEKGTGAVMCCTFGDATDVAWWYRHDLPLAIALNQNGEMNEAAGAYAGLPIPQAHKAIAKDLDEAGLLLEHHTLAQSVRVHERCDTPVEHLVTSQWFIKALDYKRQLLEAGEQITWHPAHMQARYRSWVENLAWDWCISRQRTFGVPFPLWYCTECGEVQLAEAEQLPIDPLETQPARPCQCGGTSFRPESDVMDTWATSSHTPQLAGQWLKDPELYRRVYPMSLRPQAHEIIRTWAFYTLLKALHHENGLPWKEIAISGWGVAGPGQPKISKSRGGGPLPPMEVIERYSADAVRYWAASTGFGKDAIIDEEKIQAGAKLVTKLWNIARFSERFLADYQPPSHPPQLTPADRWVLAETQALVSRATDLFEAYEYATAKSEVEAFTWKVLADNYLEIAKQRLYAPDDPLNAGARFTLHHLLLNLVKLLAPFLPYVTEQLYLQLFQPSDGAESVHLSEWPSPDPAWQDEDARRWGETLLAIATTVRRFKSEHNLPLGTELARVQLVAESPATRELLAEAEADLASVTRAQEIVILDKPQADGPHIVIGDGLHLFIEH